MGRISRLAVIFLVFIQGLVAFGASPYETYLKKADLFFNRQQFDSCTLYYYNLVNIAHKRGDFFEQAMYWYHISWLNLLQENYLQAQANQLMAVKCLKSSDIKNSLAEKIWEDMYLGLYSFKKSNFNIAANCLNEVSTPTKFVNSRMTLLVKLFLIDWDMNKHPEKICKAKTVAYIDFLKQRGDSTWFGYAMAKVSLGWCFYKEINYPDCITAYQSAIGTWELQHIESPEWINCYQQLLSVLYKNNQNESLEQWFQRISQKMDNKNKDAKLLTEFYLLKGMYFYSKNNYQEALDAYLNAQKFCMQTDNTRQSNIFENVLESYYCLNKYKETIEWVDHNSHQKLSPYSQSIVAYSFLQTENPGKATAMVKNIEIQLSSKYLFYFKTIRNLYNYYFVIGNYAKCEYYARCSLTWNLAHSGNVYINTAQSYNQLARLSLKFSKPLNNVMENFNKQLYSLVNVPYNTDIFNLPDVTQSINDYYLVYALLSKAWAFNKMGETIKNDDLKQRHWEASVANYKLALKVAVKYKLSLPKEDQKMQYSNFSKIYYRELVEVLHQLYLITGNVDYAKQMFENTEKSKSALLLSMVRGVKAQKIKLIPDSLRDAEEKIRTQTELLTRTRSEAYNLPKPDYSKIDHYNVELYTLKQQQDSLFAFYKKHFPAYYNTKFNSDVVGVDSLQHILKPGQVILQYLVGEKILTLFMVTHGEFRIFRDSIDQTFYGKIETYRRKLSTFSYEDLRDSSIRSFANQSHELYSILLRRAEPYLSGKSIVVIPDDVLTQIPFETLVTCNLKTGKKPDYRDLPYLIKKHSISYNYSATLFVLNSGSQNIKNPRLLAIAPSYKNLKIPNYINKDALAIRSDSSKISTISGTFDEVKGIQKIFGGYNLIKSNATEERFKAVAGNYDVLHLAMHGIVNNEYPMFSKLIFSHASDSVNEGFLNTYEIYNLKINTALVVLSACNSGNGKFYKGEGIISLARGFFTAGAKSVVMTLWAIADKTSQRLMNYFYANLANRQSISDALQKAKIDYIQNSDAVMAHPYFWAGYIVTGNSSTTFEVTTHRNYSRYLAIITILILIAGTIWWKRKDK